MRETETEWFSPNDAGRDIGVTGDRIRQLIRDGVIAAQRTRGGRFVIAAAEVARVKLQRAAVGGR